MALSQADFYAYSRATGAPVPEDPRERAEMAPEVLAFRRNQLKAPEQQGPDPLSVGIGVGLALAGAGGAYFGARRLMRAPKQAANAGVRVADIKEIARDVGQGPDVTKVSKTYTPNPSKVATPSTVATDIPDPWSGSETKFTPRSFLEERGSVAPVEDLTSVQQQALPQVINQKLNAVESAEDQVTGRFLHNQQIDTDFVKFSRQATEISAEAAAQRAAAFALAAQRSKAPKNARALQALGPGQGLSQEEIFHRISASASDYRPGSMEPLTQLDVAALLDPTVPTENVKDLLGTTLAVRGGRVGRNLDYEVMAEGGGMTQRGKDVDITGEFGSDVLAYNPRTGQFEIDTTTDLEDLNLTGGRTSNYDENAADYGDVEGPGGFVLTRGFKEKTKSGTTIVPGQITEATGAATGSLRQEREIDRVLPARETLEGDPAAGWTFDPQTGKAYFVGSGTRNPETRVNVAGKPIRVVEAKTGRARPLGAYQGKITVDDPSYDPSSGGKLHGRFQPATGPVSSEITTQPVTGYMTAQERLIQDEKGNWYVNQAKTKVIGEAPLRGRVGSDPNLRDLSLNRDELNGILNNGAEFWSAKGGGSALERQTFLIQHLDKYLKSEKQITLSVLQPNQKGRISPAAFDFINNIQPGIKETNIYVKPAKVNAEGMPLVSRKYRGEQVREDPIIDPQYAEMEAVPLPGKYKVSGAGGVDVREIDEALDDQARTYFAPRIETAPQWLTPGAGRPSPEEPGSIVSRPYLETQPVGFRVKSPGSFARTQNPYTGAAAAAMGPASRVSSGNYQYTPGQLKVLLEPTSQRQLQERNRFALTANLTPGGTVREGAINLGGGLGSIAAGIESLPSESATIERYGVTGGQLKQVGDVLMAQAAYKRGQQPGPTKQTLPSFMRLAETSQQLESPYHVYGPLLPSSNLQQQTSKVLRNTPINQEEIARGQATAQHLANYITAAAQRLEGPETWQGNVKLKGKGQNALMPYQVPSEAMLQQLMRAYR